MSNIPKSKEELEQLYSKLNQQYNSLLEKNQNDLIKIKQKQKTFNETIATLKQEKQQNEKKYKNDINVLMLELEKMKNGVSSTLPKKQDPISIQTKSQNEEVIDNLKNQVASSKKQISAMRDIVDLNKERIEHLEENTRKLMDQNITLTSQFQEGKKQVTALKTTINNLNKDNEQLMQKIKDLEESQKSKNVKTEVYAIQTDGDYVVSYKQHNALIEKFNNQIRELNKEIESKQEQNQHLKSRLKETNQQLKRYMERDRKNNVLIKKKTEELENLQVEMESARKSHKTERKRLTTQDSCVKCKQWQQQNKLLKQMVKSMQTMVRVREMQAERYKHRQVLNNSKIHDKSEVVTEPKKSRGELPPLNKKG